MRRALILLALLFPCAALADPTPATGWQLEELPLGLKQPSGLAWSNGLIVTDLATGRVVRVEKDGALTDLTKPLPVGIDVMGQPTGPYKVKVFWRSYHRVARLAGRECRTSFDGSRDHILLGR